MKSITVDLPEQVTEEINVLVENGWFTEETEVIRLALWEFIHRNRFALTEQLQRVHITWALQQHRDLLTDKTKAS